MLTAILHGKGRRLAEGLSADESLRAAFLRFEDLLTATVFERLAYLEPPILWQILRETFGISGWSDESEVSLISIEFWPMWTAASDTLGKAVEPDVVIQFAFGERHERVTLIVECKHRSLQAVEQLWQEWAAWEEESVSGDEQDAVWLLALGGVRHAKALVSEVQQHARQQGTERLNIAAAGWDDLLKSIARVRDCPGTNRLILADLVRALELQGNRLDQLLHDLPELFAGKAPSPFSLSTLQRSFGR
jgi:hypothetical protein